MQPKDKWHFSSSHKTIYIIKTCIFNIHMIYNTSFDIFDLRKCNILKQHDIDIHRTIAHDTLNDVILLNAFASPILKKNSS